MWKTSAVYDDLTVPQSALGDRRLALPTGRGLGGAGSVNGLGWFQGHPADFNGWAAPGATGWGWDDMVPYLRRIEDRELGVGPYHGGDGPISVTTPYHVNPLTPRAHLTDHHWLR